MKKAPDRLHALVPKLCTVVFILTAGSVFSQVPCPLIDAGTDSTLCQTAPVQLNATPGFDSYTWSPATGLSNPHIANPVTSVAGTVTYTVTATNWGPNLVTNGDFSSGDTGFYSEYISMNFYNPCYYTVNTDFFQTGLNVTDHSPTSDNMFMSIDGCMQVAVLWEQTVSVDPFTDYTFSFWATRAAVNQPIFEIEFIGNVTGNTLTQYITGIPDTNGIIIWDEYVLPGWNSAGNTAVTIRMTTTSTEGYGVDFGMDDISLRKYCEQSDSVKITFAPAPAPVMPPSTAVCQYVSLPPLQAQGQNILWYGSPGTGNPQPPIPNTGIADTTYIYYATQTLNGCESPAGSTSISVIAPPFFDLGPPVTLCHVNSVSLGPQRPDWQYLWQDALASSPRIVSSSQPGLYVLTAQNSCGQHTDSITVFPPTPPPVMPPDTTVCQYVSLPPLQAQGQNILWYGPLGAGNPQSPVPDTDIADTTYIYYATQTLNGCESPMANTTVSVIAPPFFDLGPSVTLCTIRSVNLGPARPDWQYTWQDALHTSPRTVSSTEPGLYVLTAQNSCGQYTDSVSVFPPTPPPILPPDTTVCRYAALPPLQAQGQNILWYGSPGGNGNTQTPTPDTDDDGSTVYYATQTANGCESPIANTTVSVIAPPFFDLGEPVTLCDGSSVKAGPENPDWQYQWQDSLTGSPRVISSDEAGLYILTAQNHCGQHIDSVRVEWDECLCDFFWPTAFSPNSDVYNETFKPVHDCFIEEYNLRIFNRWGELVFESRNPDEGWNGQYNGQPAQQDIYIMQLSYAALSGVKKIQKSAIDRFSLLR